MLDVQAGFERTGGQAEGRATEADAEALGAPRPNQPLGLVPVPRERARDVYIVHLRQEQRRLAHEGEVVVRRGARATREHAGDSHAFPPAANADMPFGCTSKHR